MVQKIHIELPATVEHQVETYEGGAVIHSIRSAWGFHFGNTKEEALAEMMSRYLIHHMAND
jgi:hypothetical protein